ncbi:MAG: heavy-metal-associated domain-containing protein [Anaerolineales bacterium]|nr:heavy-metal-associated domain-containing protein [Anaerolineales bacterium]
MKTINIGAPALYGDHHVTEVRRILLELDGVQDVYASSSFQVIEVTFDPQKIKEDQINACLDQAGYLGKLPITMESGVAVTGSDSNGTYFRHTATYETTKKTVSFAQRVDYESRPLWPCPGLEPIKGMDDENQE